MARRQAQRRPGFTRLAWWLWPQVDWEQIEGEFWRIVEEGEEPVEVVYGADLDTSQVGSGFPHRSRSQDPYASHSWNLNNISKLDGR
jgi:hypothetical protein